MRLRSPLAAILWETWRVTRTEAAWKLAFGIVGGLAALALGATVAPADESAALAMTLIVLPHLVPWLSLAKLNNGRPGFPLYLYYSRPVRTAVVVGLPLAYLTAMSSGIYLVSALVLRVPSGYAFPLLPVAAWMAGLTVVFVAAGWSTRDVRFGVLAWAIGFVYAYGKSMARLTAVELPDGYDWPPRLWPTLFDWPVTDYAWIALIGLASFGITVVMVTRQRRGDELAATSRAALAWIPRVGLWDRLVSLFRIPCPTSSATRAHVWLDLRSSGLPVLTIGVAFAIGIVLLSAVSGRIDAALNADPDISCPIQECFYARAWPPLVTPLSLFVMLALGGNAFGIRRKQGRTYVSPFEATQAYDTAQLAILKLLVRSVCVLAALIAIAVSAWISIPLLGDAVFIQMWEVPLNTRRSVITDAFAALTGYEQLALAVVAVVGVAVWVASWAAIGALRIRHRRRMNIAVCLLFLYGVAFVWLAVAVRVDPETASRFHLDVVYGAMRWTAAAAMALTTIYVFWRGFAEQVLTPRYASGAVAISVAFAAAWLTVLHATGMPLAGMSALNVLSVVSPALLPLMASGLAPWSYSRIRSW